MARYIVKVASGGRTANLLVVLSPDQPCSALLSAIQTRLPAVASKLGLAATNNHHITLHLETEDGPLIDTEDILSTVLPGAKETVYAVIEQTPTPTQPPAPTGPVLQLRVVTPELAHEHADVNSIATTAKPLPLSTTLSELRTTVCRHLGVPIGDGALAQLDCNCSAARQIDENASLNERGASDSDALHTLVVVYDDNKVAILQTQEPTLASIQRAAREHLQDKAVGKLLSAIGGVANHNVWEPDEVQYIKLPVLSVCSHQSHRRATRTESESDAAVDGRGLTLDLHTVECPLEITEHNKDVTLEAAGLHDCTIDGVLTVYAVQRVYSQGQDSEAAPNVGKAAIFQKRHPWEHPLGQSERGLANLLSTLHKFTDVTSGREMEECQQDAVLRIVHLMTRFPPAVRTAYVLMRGETPRPSECAALSQCLYEILKDTIPLRIIRNDPQRFFEGSRLLLGLILGKAKTLRVSASSSRFPYTAMRVYDLRSAVTMLPVRGVSVQAKSGLIDVGLYDAFAEDGVLNWDNGTDTTKTSRLDRKLSRVATLSGGIKAKVVVFNPDAVAFATKYPDEDISTVVTQAEATNLQYLATMCSSNELSVVPPSDLASASAPVLTLDRDGFLAVYVGREGCGSAGRDILMFRPLSGEEAVDVAVITQLLVPILARRNADGTAVFEAYGSHHRQVREPDEAVVVCVDLSQSMNERCGFIDIEENEDATASIGSRQPAVAPITTPPVEHPGGERLALEELKDFLQNHESFEDMLAIVRAGNGDRQRLQMASKVLQILDQLNQQQLKEKTESLAIARQRATSFFYRNQAASSQQEMITLSNRIARMKSFGDSLCAFLNYRAEVAGSLPEPRTWQPGVVVSTTAEQRTPPTMNTNFTIPNELLCPISSELMKDPVMTIDGFTYERMNIERWLYSRRTSPLTNLELSSPDLRSDAVTKEKINAYVSGRDLYTVQNTTDTQTVSMKTPLKSYTMVLPRAFVLKDLYELAFRKTMGRYPKFELRHKNAVLSTSSTQTLQMTIASADEVFVTPLDSSSSSSDARPGAMCLIKVYDSSDYSKPVCSYWEPKGGIKTLASVVFRYYRQLFSTSPYHGVRSPFTIWRSMYSTGDGHRCGQTEEHWTRLSGLLSSEIANASIHEEPFCDDRSPALIRRDLTTDTLVLKLGLGGPPSSSAHKRKTLSRLDVLKQMFDAFINRLLAYNLQTHVGLVTFGTTASLSQGITHAVEDFRHHLNNMRASGDTAVWDSIALAMDQLQQYASKYPKSKLRIICISDGEDNKSNRLVHELAAQLVGHNIVVDSFCLGDDNTALQTLSYMTGGYKFEPTDLEEAMAICEMEPVLSVLERPAAVVPRFSSRHAGSALWRFQQAKKSITVDRATRDDFPQRKSHPQLAGSFVELTSFARHASSQARADSNLRLSRIHTEIRNCGALGHPHYDIYICEENFGFWKIVMQGPPESTYAGGTFLLYVEMGEDYPMSPPKARFVTSVYHPNINRHGRICHSIFDRNWTVDTTTKNLIDTIYSLLLVPEFSDPINTVVTLNYHWDEVQFKEEAQSHIRKYATKTRAEWRAEITG